MRKNSSDVFCPDCGAPVKRGVRLQALEYHGYSLNYEQPGWDCEGCDEGILEGDDNAVHDAALHRLMAQAEHAETVSAGSR